MYFFGHIGIVLFLGFILFLPLSFVLIGSMLPDVIDKPLFLLGIIPSGRYISHTLFFVAASGIATYIITRKKLAALSLSFGVLLHLFLDSMHFVPWFYPFIDYQFVPYKMEFVLDPILISAEVIGLALLIILVKYRTRLDNMRNKLRTKFRK